MNIGDKVKIKIEKIVLGGDGLGHIGRLVVFVPYTCPGDEVLVEITKLKSNYSSGKIVEIINPSNEREVPQCPYFFQPGKENFCGGCNWQHLNYSVQIKYKLDLIQETLKQLGGVSFKGVKIKPSVSSSFIWRYRNKMQLPVRKQEGKIIAGFYSPGTHKIVDFSDCLLHSSLMNKIVQYFKGMVTASAVSIYNETTGEGLLRHLVLRQSFFKDEIELILVITKRKMTSINVIIKKLLDKFPSINGIFININPLKSNVILGNQTIRIYGKDYLMEKLGKRKYFISPASFFQVNKSQAENLYKLVAEQVRDEKATLWDIYCGCGTIGLSCASLVKRVYGIEENKSAIRDAENNARANNITNASFFHGKAEKVLSGFFKNKYQKPIKNSIVILDPPRAGCSRAVLENISKIYPWKIIYISCNPATLARDIKFLKGKGYHLKEVQLIDMFPQTAHIECLSVLERETPKGRIV